MEDASPDGGQQLSLLLVEDNPGDARLVEEALDETPYAGEFHVVSDADDALDFVNQRGEFTDAARPDLILLDWHLSASSGKAVLSALKDDEDLRTIPVIVLSGSAIESQFIEFYKQYANASIEKTNDPQEFIESIHVAVEFWLDVAHLPQPTQDEDDPADRV